MHGARVARAIACLAEVAVRRLQDRTAVVTGAASGIGQAVAVELARRGCDLALVDLQAEGLEQTRRIVEAMGRRATVHRVDVADRAAMFALADDVVAAHGAVHVLVNNAGVSLSVPFAEASLEDFDWLMGVNWWGVVHGCHVFLPHLKAADEGWIVNISSIFGVIGVPCQSAYCAAKFAVRGFTEALDLELRGTSVGVSCVHPGAVATGIIRNGRYHASSDGLPVDSAHALIDGGTSPEQAARVIVDGVARRRPRVLVGGDARWIDRFARLLPVRYRDGVRLWSAGRRRFRGAARP